MESKEKLQRKYAYVVWKLKPSLEGDIARKEKFLKQNKLEESENNLAAVQLMTLRSIKNLIKKLESDYEKSEHCTD